MTKSISLGNKVRNPWVDCNGDANGVLIWHDQPQSIRITEDKAREWAAQLVRAADEAADAAAEVEAKRLAARAEADEASHQSSLAALNVAYDIQNAGRLFGAEWPGTVRLARWLAEAGFEVVRRGDD